MYKLLIVEDEKWIRKGIRAMIDTSRNLLSDIREAENGSQAIEIWREMHPEIIITDICMPDMDGCTMCEQIYREAPETEFIIVSGYNNFEYARRALGFRAADYLLKPVDITALNDILERCIQSVAGRKNDSDMVDYMINKNRSQGEGSVIAAVVDIIDKNYDKKLNLTELARHVHVSESHLSSLFKKELGTSPIQYITNLRINRAEELIKKTSLTISDIAAMVGYSDQTYFTKVFRRTTGQNPTALRSTESGKHEE